MGLNLDYINSPEGYLHITVMLLAVVAIYTHLKYTVMAGKLSHSLGRRLGWNSLGQAYAAFGSLVFLALGLLTDGYSTISPELQSIFRASLLALPLWFTHKLVEDVKKHL